MAFQQPIQTLLRVLALPPVLQVPQVPVQPLVLQVLVPQVSVLVR
jgi:hypothetical protein